MKSLTVLTAAVSVGILACTCALGDDWPQWRGPERTGISAETGLLQEWPEGGPKLLWTAELEAEGYSSPSVVGDRIYITGSKGGKSDREGVLYALDLEGKTRWQKVYGPEWGESYNMARTAPTVDKGRVFVYGGTGWAGCYDAKTGQEKWSVDTMKRFAGQNITWGIAESPLVIGSMMICQPGGKDAAVVALHRDTGKTVWTSIGLSDKSAYCSPIAAVYGKRTLIVTQTDNNIVGLDSADGAVLWKVAQRNKYAVHPNTPVLFDDKVLVSCGYGYGSQMLELSPDGGGAEEVWRRSEMDVQFQGVILVDGRIYGSSDGGQLHCLNPTDGNILYTVAETSKPSILYADRRLYAYSEKGGTLSLVEVGPQSYTVKGTFKITHGNGPHWAHPVVANGVLYVRRGKMLMAYDIRGG